MKLYFEIKWYFCRIGDKIRTYFRCLFCGFVKDCYECSNRKYWHEISDEEYGQIIGKRTWGYVWLHYKQPEWCVEPYMLDAAGCCSLILKRKDINYEYCKGCPFSRHYDGSLNDL
jgi:hypothetical protein